MSHAPPSTARPLPGWLVLGASLVIAFHLFALGIYVLAAPSGPWPAGMGVSMIQGPQFAFAINNFSFGKVGRQEVKFFDYVRFLKMTHNYHYMANRPQMSGIRVQIKLRDADGEVIRTVQLPDPKANFWVQQRQLNMIRGLSDDQPVETMVGDEIPGINQKVPTVDIWDSSGIRGGNEWQLKITPTQKHLLPKDRPVMRPSAYARALAGSMGRYLCRQTGAASAEVFRISREPVAPMMLNMDDAPPESFNTLTSNFGEFSK
jgi:hypothetical protein